MPRTNLNQTWDSQGNLISQTEQVVSDEQIEQEEAGARLRQVVALLRNWMNDTKTAAEITLMTPAERIQRQAQYETRIAALSGMVLRLIRLQALD